tara:strand:- start:3941 stop:4879 length:939 start_codon:yes stop_codon:yes gene_type:complete
MAVQESRVLPPQFIEDLATDYGKQLTALTSQAIDTSKFAPTVAAQDALQTRAATLANQGIGSFQPFVTAAQTQAADAATQLGTAATGIAGAEALLGTGAGTGAGSISSYMSPYQTQVIDATLAEFDRNRAIQEQQIRDQQAQLGVLGAGRAGVQLAEFGTGQARERALLQAGLLQQGFGQAQTARQQDLANRRALAQQRAGLAGQQLGQAQFQTGLAQLVPSLERGDISTLGSVGAIQQAQRQAELDAQREANRLAAFEPYERLGTFGSGVAQLISGYPGQRQFTTVPNPTPLQTSLGIGATLAGIYGSLRR